MNDSKYKPIIVTRTSDSQALQVSEPKTEIDGVVYEGHPIVVLHRMIKELQARIEELEKAARDGQ